MADHLLAPAAYRDSLREVLKSKARIILNANGWYAERVAPRGSPRPEKAAFQLPSSDRCQRELISLWELFDERDEFQECVEQLASCAERIRQKTPFTMIATATATAKHLLEQIHALVESEREPVRVETLPHFPYLATDRRARLDFGGEQVLLLADVVASGSLVRHLAEVVEELGGNVVAALAVVLVGKELIDQLPQPDHAPLLEIGRIKSPKRIQVFNLTDYPIPRLESHEVDTSQLIRIDAYTAYPEESPTLRNGVMFWFERRRSFRLAEMYEHFDRSGALDFDFFAMEGSRFTAAVRLDLLLDHYGDAIWERIEPCLLPESLAPDAKPQDSFGDEDALTLVTTFNVGDRRFKEFVVDRLKASGRTARVLFMHRRDSADNGDGAFFVSTKGKGLADPADDLQDQHVVLLLSSIQSSHTLRDLASYVAAAGARKLIVVCLLNRMGLRTRNFIERIQRLLCGLNPSQDDQANFEFISVYNLFDLESEDIAKMQDGVAALFDYYKQQTAVPSFRRWVDQVRKYFQSRSLTNREFRDRPPESLPRPFSLDLPPGQRCIVTTIAGKLSLLCAQRVLLPRGGRMVEELGVLDKKQDLYKLYAILLLDLSHLRITGQAWKISERLIDRVRELRKERFDWEAGGAQADAAAPLADRVAARVDLETHLIFGLALFSYLDHQRDDYTDLAGEFLTAGRTLEQWRASPVNLLAHFGDERVVWVVSMLLHLSRVRFRDPDVEPEFKEQLARLVREAIQLFKQMDEELAAQGTLSEEEAARRTRIRRCRDNLALLLVDLRVHDESQPTTIIRFLHSHLLRLSQRHSPIDTNLNRAIVALEAAIDVAWPRGTVRSSARRRVRVDTPEVQQAMEDAVFTAGLLEQISQAARELFHFTPCRPEDARRFLAPDNTEGFGQDVIQLGDILQAIRINNLASYSDLNLLTNLRSCIQNDLWDRELPLQQALKRYIVPLRITFLKSMEAAEKSFKDRKRPCAPAFDACLPRLRREIAGRPELFVLVDPFLLSEALRNLCTNVRHSLPESPVADCAERVDYAIETVTKPGDEGDPTTFVQLFLTSKGRPLDRKKFEEELPTSTFGNHKHDLLKFGGRLEINDLHPGFPVAGVSVELRLMVRQPEVPS